jgi:hypothetical protein
LHEEPESNTNSHVPLNPRVQWGYISIYLGKNLVEGDRDKDGRNREEK